MPTRADDLPAPGPSVTAPGGWRRAVVAFALGIVAGAVVAVITPRDDAPERRRDDAPDRR